MQKVSLTTKFCSFVFPILCALLIPVSMLADGGMVKIAEGRYVVNISAVPISPFAGERQKMLISFGDLKTDKLITQDIAVNLEVKESGHSIFRKDAIAQGGILDFEYTYPKVGYYELFIRFRLPSEPNKTYEPEDFLIEVKEPKQVVERIPRSMYPIIFSIAVGGFILGYVVGRKES